MIASSKTITHTKQKKRQPMDRKTLPVAEFIQTFINSGTVGAIACRVEPCWESESPHVPRRAAMALLHSTQPPLIADFPYGAKGAALFTELFGPIADRVVLCNEDSLNEGIISDENRRTILVRPATWRKDLGLKRKRGKGLREAAYQLYPDDRFFSGHLAYSRALLLAEWARWVLLAPRSRDPPPVRPHYGTQRGLAIMMNLMDKCPNYTFTELPDYDPPEAVHGPVLNRLAQ